MINILYITTSSRFAGAEKNLFYVLRDIDRTQFNVKVCILKSEADGVFVDELRNIGIETIVLGIRSKFEFWKLLKLIPVIKQFKPDIIHTWLYFDNIVGRVLGKIMKVPIIISGQQNVNTRQKKTRNLIEKITRPLTDCVTANTEAGRQLSIKRDGFDPKKVVVIYNGIENNLSDEEVSFQKPDGFILGTVGFLDEQKGVQYGIDALVLLESDYKLIVIGEGPLRKQLEEYAAKCGVKDRVLFLGFQKNAARYMKYFDAYVLSSLWEGLPNVMIEAIQAGVPVVATNVGGVSEIIEDGVSGFIVPPADPEKLAAKIKQVREQSSNVTDAMTQNAQQTVKEKLGVDRLVKEHEELYKRLLEEKKV